MCAHLCWPEPCKLKLRPLCSLQFCLWASPQPVLNGGETHWRRLHLYWSCNSYIHGLFSESCYVQHYNLHLSLTLHVKFHSVTLKSQFWGAETFSAAAAAAAAFRTDPQLAAAVFMCSLFEHAWDAGGYVWVIHIHCLCSRWLHLLICRAYSPNSRTRQSWDCFASCCFQCQEWTVKLNIFRGFQRFFCVF